jgi:hypothetical protein
MHIQYAIHTGLAIELSIQVPLTVHPQKDLLQNVYLQNVQFTKRPVYKTSSLQNVQFTKRSGFKTSTLLNVQTINLSSCARWRTFQRKFWLPSFFMKSKLSIPFLDENRPKVENILTKISSKESNKIRRSEKKLLEILIKKL